MYFSTLKTIEVNYYNVVVVISSAGVNTERKNRLLIEKYAKHTKTYETPQNEPKPPETIHSLIEITQNHPLFFETQLKLNKKYF